MSIQIANLGFPRIGLHRELKSALESYWSGKSDAKALLDRAAQLRATHWQRQKALGVTHIPSNDFSLYDHVLDTSVMVGAIPDVYGWEDGDVPLDAYFAMARGSAGVPALEMTKWFDTNYHYMVPELTRDQVFCLASTQPLDAFLEAKALGIDTRPVLLGPVTYLKLAKSKEPGFDPLILLPELLPVYAEILRHLAVAGADWVQIDEPALVLDLDDRTRNAFRTAYDQLTAVAPNLKIMLTTYFGGLGDNLATVLRLPVAGLHLDLVRGPEQLELVTTMAPADLVLSLGIIDGRNVWRSDLEGLAKKLRPVVETRGADKVILAPSCSLLHVPIDLALEQDLDADLRSWLAFAVQKLDELGTLAQVLGTRGTGAQDKLTEAARILALRRVSPKARNPQVRDRLAAVTSEQMRRSSAFAERWQLQQAQLSLPALPTTTIGSFPQTEAVRKARASHARSQLSDADYQAFLRKETDAAIRWQEEIGLDVLVHGEFERNDMVQYFGEQLSGFAFTKHGWVQSYGSRCVRPPIIFGDVSRPQPMTVAWTTYAQSQTKRPVKGMLTGPITMLQWSFVRDDLGRDEVCRQIALALRDEVCDLETNGIRIIQVDEPAIREGLPLRRADWQAYLDWAVDCFRLATSGVADRTQIHTHMCYSEFNDIIDAIGRMDADVISIETARSKMELLEAFTSYHYPNQIGPGVYDIHAPRCPSREEIVALLAKAAQHLSADQLWVNPDCGLKTRSWDEVRPALANMVAAARQLRVESKLTAAQ
ncbi:MAG: 5-methyltetrahydropteroyltriglutamate--homocysteine S-methyltransferase [Rhodospirillaceae bacterium]|nr:MAG: 5-methyltetrahydropteroyltriglutamate--homocysteine S-methyltransferase [Rhodospirillaceae bacterium]